MAWFACRRAAACGYSAAAACAAVCARPRRTARGAPFFCLARPVWADSDRVFCCQRSGDVALRFAVVLLRSRRLCRVRKLPKKSKLQQNRVGALGYTSARQTCKRAFTTCRTQASPRKRLFRPKLGVAEDYQRQYTHQEMHGRTHHVEDVLDDVCINVVTSILTQ